MCYLVVYYDIIPAGSKKPNGATAPGRSDMPIERETREFDMRAIGAKAEAEAEMKAARKRRNILITFCEECFFSLMRVRFLV